LLITLPFNLERNRREAGFEELEHKISQRYDPSDFVDSQPPDEAQVPNSIPGPELAIVTLLGEPTVRAYSEYEVYDKMSKLTMPSIQRYADRWGHPLLMMPNHMIDKSKQAYWAKIPLMEHYLDQGYKYVLYTDIDVLFLKDEVPLSSFLVPGKDIIGVNECVRRNETSDAIRSGFLLLRNSNKTMNFLKLWKESFPYFQQMANPELSALEVPGAPASIRLNGALAFLAKLPLLRHVRWLSIRLLHAFPRSPQVVATRPHRFLALVPPAQHDVEPPRAVSGL